MVVRWKKTPVSNSKSEERNEKKTPTQPRQMSYTVTLTKKPGSADTNVFLGNRAGTGSALSEWQVLQRNDEIRNLGIIFVVVESTDPKLFQPSLNIRYGEDFASSSTYPARAPLKAADISSWILKFVRQIRERGLQFDADGVNSNAVVKHQTSEKAIADGQPTPGESVVNSSPVQESAGWSKPVIFGATLAAAVLAGVGIAFATSSDYVDEQEEVDALSSTPLFLVDEQERPIKEWGQN